MVAFPGPESAVPPVPTVVEFYNIALAQLADGEVSVMITATSVDDEEPQLLDREIVSERVPSLDEAFALIKIGIERSLAI